VKEIETEREREREREKEREREREKHTERERGSFNYDIFSLLTCGLLTVASAIVYRKMCSCNSFDPFLV
jgi:hypothetical protein